MKNLLLIFMFSFLVLVFSSCNNHTSTIHTPENFETQEQIQEALDKETENTNGDGTNENIIDEKISFVTGPDGAAGLTSTATEKGIYSIEYWNNGAANILYTDVATRQKVFLCERAECQHNDDSCRSYISTLMQPYLFHDDNYLYIAHKQGIIRTNFDGSERQNLIEFNNNEFMQRGVAISDKNIYTALASYDEQNNEFYKLVKITKETGEMLQLATLNFTDFLVGAYENKLIIKSTHFDGENTPGVFMTEDEWSSQTNAFYTFDIDTFEFDEIINYPIETYGFTVKNYNIFLFEYATGKLEKIDVKTKEKVEIAVLQTTGISNTTRIEGIYNNLYVHYIILPDPNDLNNMLYKMFAFDFEKNESKEITLSATTKGTQTPLRNIIEIQDLLFVVNGETEYTSFITGMDGSKEPIVIFLPNEVFISQEDFFNSTDNYLSIANP